MKKKWFVMYTLSSFLFVELTMSGTVYVKENHTSILTTNNSYS
ncbi:hypothetical protein [Rummeliibacillus sp. SL167]|nr:hypothetical protein [Rummeliibacillus sp. SL167]